METLEQKYKTIDLLKEKIVSTQLEAKYYQNEKEKNPGEQAQINQIL